LNSNLLSYIRSFTKRNEKDVFKSTQGRLTRIYSGLLMLFLILFNVIVYSVLYVVILKNQERELQSLVKQEAGFIENYLSKNEQNSLNGMGNQEVVFAGVNQFFYYVVNPNGEIIMGNEENHRLRPYLLDLVNNRMQGDQQIQKKTLNIEGIPKGRGNQGEFHSPEAGQDVRLMIASQRIYNNGQFVGQLYVGKDISFAYRLFHSLLMILVVIGVIFFGVALYISVVMSKRAMIPISGAFSRQREFVADASHELRTPLSVLLSSIDAMEMTIESQKEDFVGKMLANMRQE
jgi:signal transduction histidine kinase